MRTPLPHEVARINRKTVALRAIVAWYDSDGTSRGSDTIAAFDAARAALDIDIESELLARLRQAVRYLEHPDVAAVTANFALPGTAMVARCKEAIEKAEAV